MSTSTPTSDRTVEYDPFAGPAIAMAVPTTEPQREIWTAALVGQDASLAYNESVTLWMKGPLDLGVLRASLDQVAARHESLRATFSGDGLSMLVAAEGTLPLDVVDATSLPESTREEHWQALLEHEVTVPFDLTRGPLARVRVFRVGPEDHRVVFTAHHIVCDGWSTAVVVGDWAALYSANIQKTTPKLPHAEAFSAYAREQASVDQDASSDEAYWLAQFSDQVPVLELPVDRPRPPLKTYAAHRFDAMLDEGLVRDLRRAGSSARASLFATLLAGFQALLARLSGQDDLVVGIPAAGQSVGGHATLVGHCVNMLPLKARASADRPFRDLLNETKGTVLDAQDHQQYTFGRLLRRLPLARDPSRLPLVSVVFNLDRGMGPEAMKFEGLHTELSTNPRRYENFDLFLNAVELGGKVTLECQFNTDLFERETVRRWLALYERLLRSICENPDEKIGWLRILPDAELQMLEAWNAATALAFDRSACVHHLIEGQAARTPSAIAVEAEGTTLTYAELDARAEALAARLRELGVRRGQLVGLCVERSAGLLVGLLGILKAGAAYVPLDPAYPTDRLAFMVRESKMPVLVTQEKVRAELPLEAPNVVLLEQIQPGPTRTSRDGDATPDDPAYVIYTSGSTGVPKGVLVPHRAVVNLLHSVRETPGMQASDAVLAVTTLSFDIAVSELILPLVVGARIVLATREVASDGQRLLALMHASKATFLDATPATWRLLLAAGWSGGEGLKAICTGEALPLDLSGELLSRCASVWNGYGPTETTVWSTFWRVQPGAPRILIGKAIANTLLYVLDARMQRVPIGAIGELFIGGAGVTLGYHERPELTRERFLADPFAGGADARMYKTGDLVRFLADGNMECLGRNDSQVKLRGYRIELGEIENALGTHPGVAQATVIVREDRPGDKRLVGYVVPAPSQAVTDGDLRAHLKRTLPDYMVPQQFVHLDVMPVLPNGKTDRKKLPAPQAARAGSDEEFVAPVTGTEKTLAKLWEEVLAVGRIGLHDDFFALGGHSLLASQLIARLKRDHGVEISFRKIFEAPTVSKLAAVVDASKGSEATPRPALARVARGETSPLTVAQRRMWLLEEMDPKQRVVHNLLASWRFDGPFDADALERALDEIVRRHAMFRTNVKVVDDQPVQLVHPDRKIALKRVDLTSLPEGERESALAAERDESVKVPFQLDVDPLFKVTLFKLASDRHVLVTVQHNIVWDGWSFDIFLGELSAIYTAFAKGAPSPLPPLPIDYADFAHWQRTWLEGPEYAAQAAFWRERLGSATLPLQLPTDRVRKGTRSHAGRNEGIHLPSAKADALTALGRAHGATLFMVVFAAFGVLLHRRTGQRDLLVGTPMRARTQPELEGLVGLFVNTVALTTHVEPSMTFLELLGRVREVTLDAFTNQDVPLDTLGIRPPMMRALFSLQDATTRPLRMGEATIQQQHALAPVAASELMLWAMESRKDFLLMLNFSTDLFDVATAHRWLHELATIFDEVVRAPDQRIGAMPILPADELAFIARACGDTSPPSETVGSLVQGAAAARPDAVAVDWDGKTLTFGELAGRVLAEAHALADRGVGSGSRVAIRSKAGPDALVATLATLAAGATLDLGEDGAPAHTIESVGDGAASGGWPHVSLDAVAYAQHGATVRQGALARVVRALAGELDLGNEVIVLGTPAGRGVPIWAWLLPLVAGARVVAVADAEALKAKLASAPTASAIVDVGAARAIEGLPGSRARKAVVVGRPSPTLAAALAKSGAGVTVIEVSASLGLPISVHPLPAADAPVTLGRPALGTKWAVRDAQGQAAPVGVPGELTVDVGAGPARTGDRVALREDGTFEHFGRTDGQLVLQGTLVDTARIARALAEHPAVAEAHAMAFDDLTGEPRLVAFCAARSGAGWTETELRARVRGALGDAMVPRLFVELDALPRDASGAVDEERLTSPYAAASARDYVAPRTDAERYLGEVWQEALGVARIGAFDNFFDLGGHSLLCFRVIARIERDKGVRLSPRLLLLNSLEQVAVQLEGTAGGNAARPRDPAPEASPRQERHEADGSGKSLTGGIRDWVKRIVKR